MVRRLLFLLAFSAPALAFDSAQLKKVIPAPAGAKSASLVAIAADSTHRLWVTDSANHQIHAYSPDGAYIKSIGRRGSAPGEFSGPRGIAVAAGGELYVADSGNARVQIFSADGQFQSSFGQKGSEAGQLQAPWQLAISHDGAVLVVDKDSARVQLFSKDGIFLNAFETGSPIHGLGVDAAGRIYTAHQKLKQVEQRSSAGQLLKTYTGAEPGLKGFGEPGALALSESGELYVADPDHHHFREMDLSGRTRGTFGQAGSAEGQFRSLDGLAVVDDMLYVCDARAKRITVLSLMRQNPLPPLPPSPVAKLQVRLVSSMNIQTDRLAWNPDGTLHTLSLSRGELLTHELATQTTTSLDLKASLGIRAPAGLATAPSSGSLFVSDPGNDRVVKIDKKGELVLEYKNLSRPQGLSCSPQGVLFVADSGRHRFQAFNHQGLFQYAGGEKGTGPGQLKNPVALAWDKERVYVVDAGNKKIATFNTSGRFVREIGTLGPEILEEPRQVAVDREGNIFVLDAARGRLLAYDPQGIYLGGFGTLGKAPGTLNRPKDFALNENGDLVIAEEGRLQFFQVVLLPPTPSGLRAEGGEGHITLKWNAVSTRIPSRYVIYRAAPMGEFQKLKDTVDTTFIDDKLTPNTTYTYTVAAQSVQGTESMPSGRIQAMAQEMTSGPRVEIVAAKIEDIFSAHYKYYSRVPAGKLTVQNNGTAPIQKLKILFAIQGYMDYPSETTIAELSTQEMREVAFTATFNNRILEVSETTPMQAQVKVTYYVGDVPVTFEKNLPFKLHSRNTILWDQKEQFASFVTPNDPPVIDFARAAAVPFGQSRQGTPMPDALVTAWSVFSALGTYGISYVPRPNNPYDRVSLDTATVDSLQFARETLSRKSGDCADVVALLASALESLTVTTCALDVPGHLFLMFDTGLTQKEALGFPDSMLVSYAGTYWIPLEATLLGASFTEAWKKGAAEYQKWSSQKKLRVIDIHQAWKTFEPVTLPDVASGARAPSLESIEQKFIHDWKALVELRWQTSLAKAKAAAAESPASGEPWMRLGFLAVEFKRYEEAKDYFLKARTDPATAAAAYNNLGNLAVLRQDLESALGNYTQALEKDPKDPQIHLNLARVYLKQKKSQKASAAYENAIRLDKSLREQFPDVTSLAP